jgi:hypothetical protein
VEEEGAAGARLGVWWREFGGGSVAKKRWRVLERQGEPGRHTKSATRWIDTGWALALIKSVTPP